MTGVLADRMPAELHLFRNYGIPGRMDEPRPKAGDNDAPFTPLPRPNGWRLLNVFCFKSVSISPYAVPLKVDIEQSNLSYCKLQNSLYGEQRDPAAPRRPTFGRSGVSLMVV